MHWLCLIKSLTVKRYFRHQQFWQAYVIPVMALQAISKCKTIGITHFYQVCIFIKARLDETAEPTCEGVPSYGGEVGVGDL